MPYIVTTKERVSGSEFNVVAAIEGRNPWTPRSQVISRRAVGTLDEARDEVFRIVHGYEGHVGSDYIGLRVFESGGTVGPLPDGTIIEVERQPDDFDVAAFNARETH